MSRDSYPGVPKRRAALLNSDGDIEAPKVGGSPQRIAGTATLSAGTVTVNDARFTADSFVVSVAGKHPYPIDEGFNWFVGDGYLTISGSTDADFTVSYEVKIV